MRTLGIRSADELRRINHKVVLAWEAYMREFEHVEASTVRRRLTALSSLLNHLVKHGAADRNPVRDVERAHNAGPRLASDGIGEGREQGDAL